MTVDVICDHARLRPQVGNLQIRYFPTRVPFKTLAFPYDGICTRRNRVGNKLARVLLFPSIGEERIPRLDHPAVSHQVVNSDTQAVQLM